jgi:hypothetical protein
MYRLAMTMRQCDGASNSEYLLSSPYAQLIDKLKVPICVLTNGKIGLASSYSRREFYQNLFMPHPVKDLQMLSEHSFYYLNLKVVFKQGPLSGLALRKFF